MKRTALLASLLSLAATPALAHPGDHTGLNLSHLLTEPDHLAIIAGVVAVGYFGWRQWRARSGLQD